MLWGGRQVASFSKSIDHSINCLNVTTVLGMNEPQESRQANMTAVEGSEMWQQYLQPLKAREVRLGSPAPSGASGSKKWLQDFMEHCGENCTVDFFGITNSEDYHDTFNLTIWVTEWACQNMGGPSNQCSMSEISDFLREMQGFMDRTEWIERYAWYGQNAMMDPDGLINDLGRQYIDVNGNI
ncbi:hypothetical protein B0H10DRAFT_2169497 [Mycena sp. CBHHK59/15]|nr:hypothetical protein B0H10DRAFT_2169497 [Mycena sp. CBHHK59/15]